MRGNISWVKINIKEKESHNRSLTSLYNLIKPYILFVFTYCLRVALKVQASKVINYDKQQCLNIITNVHLRFDE